MNIWEDVPQDNGFYLRRTPIFGGWLVQAISDVLSRNADGERRWENDEWRTSITFVPDPQHQWDLSEHYSKQDKEVIEEYYTDEVSTVYLVDTGKIWNTETHSYDKSIIYKDPIFPDELLSMEAEAFRERFKPVLQ